MSEEIKKPYRDLSKEEQESLFSFYDKHNGNILEMSKDKDTPFKAKSQIYYYRDTYDFIAKLSKIKKERADKFKEEWEKKLKSGKSKAIEKAIWLLETRAIKKIDKDGNEVKMNIVPDNKDIKTAYEILKIELGEPTTISKNTNIDQTEVEKALNILKNGIEESNTTISDRQSASKSSTNTVGNIKDDSKEGAQKSNNDTAHPIREESNSSISSHLEVSSV